MKLKGVSVVAAALAFAQASANKPPALNTQRERISYGIGIDLACKLERLGIDLDLDFLILGLRQAHLREKLLSNEADWDAITSAQAADLEDTQVAAVKKPATDNTKRRKHSYPTGSGAA